MQFTCAGLHFNNNILSSFIKLNSIYSKNFSYGTQIPRTLTEQIQFVKRLGIDSPNTNNETQISFKLPKSSRSLVIALEGQIGVGKSTLCKQLEKNFPNLCSAYKEQTNDRFLKLFYDDPKKYGFAFQWGMLKTRQFQLQMAKFHRNHGDVPPKLFYFWDRSMLGDYMFALWNHLLGGISKPELNVYESELGGNVKQIETIPFISEVDCFVLLNDDPSNCKQRVEEQRRNPNEIGIPLDYYCGIDDMHFNFFIKLLERQDVPAMILQWGNHRNLDQVLESIFELAIGKRKSPRVQRIKQINLQDQLKKSKSYLLYNSEEDLLRDFASLQEKGTIDGDVEDIFISQDLMEKKIDFKETAKQYNIVFHSNTYKRIVLWHLSKWRNVYFFTKE